MQPAVTCLDQETILQTNDAEIELQPRKPRLAESPTAAALHVIFCSHVQNRHYSSPVKRFAAL